LRPGGVGGKKVVRILGGGGGGRNRPGQTGDIGSAHGGEPGTGTRRGNGGRRKRVMKKKHGETCRGTRKNIRNFSS